MTEDERTEVIPFRIFKSTKEVKTMKYESPEIFTIGIQSNEVKNMGADTASGCNSSCCFTRESSSW